MAITLRAVEEGDNDFLYRLYASTRAAELDAWGWEEAQREVFLQFQFRAQQYHYRTNLPNATHQIICDDNQPVGRIIVNSTAAALDLSDIALLPEYRGRGIGSALISNVLASAAQSGRVVRLHVEVHNRAQLLYQRLGFRVVAQTPTHYLMEASPAVIAEPQH